MIVLSLNDYEKPSVTTDIILFRVANKESENTRRNAMKELQVLLVSRDKEPDMGKWSIPGGFVDIDEDIEENVFRKLRIKTGVHGDFYFEQLYSWGKVNRDSRGRVISISYLGLCTDADYTVETCEMKARWMNVYDVLNGNYGELAFDHKEIIQYALERIKNKIEYTDIAFHLLPDTFTIRECQDVYELILGKQLYNFRRNIAEYIEPTDEVRKIEGKQFRPSALYKVKENKTSKF